MNNYIETHLPECRIYTLVNLFSIGLSNGLAPVGRHAIT